MSTEDVLKDVSIVLLKLAACNHNHPCTPRRVFPFFKQYGNPLSLGSLKRVREHTHVTLNRALVPQELHVSPIDPDLTFSTLLEVFVTAKRREAPVLGDDDLLAAGEFVLGATESFDGCCAVFAIFFKSANAHLRQE